MACKHRFFCWTLIEYSSSSFSCWIFIWNLCGRVYYHALSNFGWQEAKWSWVFPPPKKTVAVTVIVASAGSEMWSTTNEQGHGCSPRGTWIYFRNAVPVLITSIRLSNYLDWYSSLLFGPHKELFYISFKLCFVSPVTKEADEIGAWIL